MNPPACSTKRVRHEHKSQNHVKFGEVSFLFYYEYDKSHTAYASTQIVLEIMCSIYKNSKIFIILLKSNSDIFTQQSCSFKSKFTFCNIISNILGNISIHCSFFLSEGWFKY
ncbi:hypothetical protein CDAR_414941 [Caerostris darwini]|uniref:Uncharacterized protein n=1 Tax=Caerostris darwini TaxID=1538125 RepID=A0AAV4NFU1_9ARAC|nr:hypothetical protein CDAR_414941 [Caerostris darwini]